MCLGIMSKDKDSVLQEVERVAQAIYDKKGFNIIVLDVRNVCTMTDYFIIAEGTVDRHVKALSDAVENELEKTKKRPLYTEGKQSGEWAVLDYGDFIVHLLIPELREKYALEQIWRESKIVDITFKTEASHPDKQRKLSQKGHDE